MAQANAPTEPGSSQPEASKPPNVEPVSVEPREPGLASRLASWLFSLPVVALAELGMVFKLLWETGPPRRCWLRSCSWRISR